MTAFLEYPDTDVRLPRHISRYPIVLFVGQFLRCNLNVQEARRIAGELLSAADEAEKPRRFVVHALDEVKAEPGVESVVAVSPNRNAAFYQRQTITELGFKCRTQRVTDAEFVIYAMWPPEPERKNGPELRRLRLAMGIGQATVSRATGISLSTLSRIERGTREATPDELSRLKSVMTSNLNRNE